MTRARRTTLSDITAVTAILLAGAVLTSPAHAFDASGVGAMGMDVARLSGSANVEGWRAAPTLMLGLALAAGLPLLTLLARMIRPLTRSPEATRRYRPGHDDNFVAEIANLAGAAGHPFVEIEAGGKGRCCAIPRDMLRIGRENDNDIRIPNASVHRYHAAIHREDYNDWHITDLSGLEGNGLIVNGRRCCQARLSDGDVIQLGPGRLRFRAGPA
jgi:hypothetical protein